MPRQIIVAHAALADRRNGRLAHDERAARAALGLAGAEEGTTRVWVDDWRMTREGDAWRARIAARAFRLRSRVRGDARADAERRGGLLAQGRARPQEASYYYSVPQLRVAGTLERGRGRETVRGIAWYDHEWSSRYMAPEAEGWDWIGLDLDDGGALMACRMRARDGTMHYAGATLAGAAAAGRAFAPSEVSFAPLRRWRSPRTGTEYPVAMRVRVGAREWLLEPLMDDQELDARASTGTIYWEGAVRASRRRASRRPRLSGAHRLLAADAPLNRGRERDAGENERDAGEVKPARRLPEEHGGRGTTAIAGDEGMPSTRTALRGAGPG
ncbi:MAG: lipocalin family protein [Burkholderiales bacterium]|nr:lipocalin family protein [Burkholderiales bacterium]